MKHYAGLDVSLEETAICVVDQAGRIVKEARVLSEPAALVGFFQALGLTVERIGLESSVGRNGRFSPLSPIPVT